METLLNSRFFPIIIVLSIPPALYGRFDPEDARLIDPEERHNTESWNDKNSYRYPKHWNDIWSDSSLGYRVNAGSLNASRFNYEDDVMIAPRPLDEFTASFYQSRREDLVDQTLEREIRVGWRFVSGMRVSLLGDVNTLKEFGDLGVALALHESEIDRTEVYYWSVDHYYASKRSDEAAQRNEYSHTFGIRSYRKQKDGIFGWQLRAEVDTPIDWDVPSLGWRYSYENRHLSSRLELPFESEAVLYGCIEASQKFEKKVAFSGGLDGSVFKTMQRRTLVTEVGVEYKAKNEAHFQAAVQSVKRAVAYEYGLGNRTYTGWSETLGPRDTVRNELGLILTRHTFIADNFGIQQGVMVNNAYLREDVSVWHTNETKFQALFDFKLNENTFIVLNTTWDIDQIVNDYPYSKDHPFRPWGGGDLQFMMRM